MAGQKQALDIQVSKDIIAAQSSEHLRGRSEGAEKYAMSKGNYGPTCRHLDFEIASGGKVRPTDTGHNIPERMMDILERRGIKDPNEGLVELKYRTVANFVFGGSHKRTYELAFGTQNVDSNEGANNTRIKRISDTEHWAGDVYSFMSGKYGEQNTAAFIVHLDELNPHVHCTLLPIKDGRFAYKEIFAGKDKFRYSVRMKQLHTDFFVEASTRWEMSRGTSISETGTRHRTTGEHRRMLSEECTTIEKNIDHHQKVLMTFQSDTRLVERRVRGFTVMVDDLEKSKAEKEALLSAVEQDSKVNKGDTEQLAAQVKSLEKELADINRQLADKQEKLQMAGRQLAELKEGMDAIEEHTGELEEKAYKYSRDMHPKVDTLLKDALLENVVGEYRNVSAQVDMVERQLLDGSLVQSTAERSTGMMHCTTMLFLSMADDATTFTEARGGGGSGSDPRPFLTHISEPTRPI